MRKWGYVLLGAGIGAIVFYLAANFIYWGGEWDISRWTILGRYGLLVFAIIGGWLGGFRSALL
jgi:hypothetical protein